MPSAGAGKTKPPAIAHVAPLTSPSPILAGLLSSYAGLPSDHLSPPFPISTPPPSSLPLAITYAILSTTLPVADHPLLPLLHSLSIASGDAYAPFTSTLLAISLHVFPSLLPLPKYNFLYLTSLFVQLSAADADKLVVSLFRRIPAGDFSLSSLSLSLDLLFILLDNWEWVIDNPTVLTSGLYVYLRLLADHGRLAGGDFPKLDELKRKEIHFCVKAMRNCFGLCFQIGRDLLRLLQDVAFIPEFKEVWKDLISEPRKFCFPPFASVEDLYRRPTPKHYFLLRLSPEMETELRFLMSNVKWGSQKRYQLWFAKKHLGSPERETAIADIVRFICCAHHPTNEILQSDVVARWAIIGWLLDCCRRNYFTANVKLALFYDWLFYDDKTENIMNVEPAMLLMVNSATQRADMAGMLLEFLLLLVDNYDAERKKTIVRGVISAFEAILKKGVVSSLQPLTSPATIPPTLAAKLSELLSKS